MTKNEWKSLLHNKLLLLVLIAIVLIPTIYAGIFVDSIMDPYGNVDQLPVAVVNKDKSVEYKGETLHIGDDFIDKLKDNDSLQFNFVDEEVASNGLRNGTFYMVITVPEDFSKNASTVMDDNPQKMELDYEVNPGTNYIASKLSESAIVKIKNEIQKSVTETYTETVFDSIAEAGDGMQDAADGAKELKDGIGEASDGNKTISKNLKKLSKGSITLANGTSDLQSGLKKYTNGVSTLNNSTPLLITGVNTLNDGAAKVKDGADAVNDGTQKYVAGVNQLAGGLLGDGTKENPGYINGVEQVYAGAQQLSGLSELGKVKAGIAAAYDGTGTEEKQGSAQLTAGLQQITASVTALKGSTTEESLKSLAGTLKTAADVCNKSNTAVASANQIITQSSDGLAGYCVAASDEITKQKGIIEAASTQLQTDSAKVNGAIGNANKELQTKVNQANSDISASASDADAKIAGKISEANGEIRKAADKARNAGDTELADKLDAISVSEVGEVTPTKVEVSTIAPVELGTITYPTTDTLVGIKTGVDDLKKTATTNLAKCDLTEASAGLNKISEGINAASTQMGDDPFNTLLTGLQAATAGSEKLTKGLAQLQAATKDFDDAGAGIVQLNAGLKTLTSNDAILRAGSQELLKNGPTLTDGTQTLATGAKQLADGTETLADKSVTLSEGVKTLASNNKSLNDGAKKLNSGANEIKDGSKKLYDGSEELGDGMQKLYDGSDELRDGLQDGADEVKDNKANDNTYKMFAEPVTDNETKLTEVKNNGHGMLPYMMSVGLWVGALAFCLIYPLMKYDGKLKSGIAWWASKATVLYPVAVLQGALLIVLLHKFIGFDPVEMNKTIAFAALAAVAFTSIMYFFNITLGKVGSFIMLVFMVIQLAGSAGTYPMELSPAFVEKIHKYVPFTYTVDAFRSTIAGGESIHTSIVVMVAIIIVFSLLTVIAFAIKTRRIRENKFILFDWLEEKGLA